MKRPLTFPGRPAVTADQDPSRDRAAQILADMESAYSTPLLLERVTAAVDDAERAPILQAYADAHNAVLRAAGSHHRVGFTMEEEEDEDIVPVVIRSDGEWVTRSVVYGPGVADPAG